MASIIDPRLRKNDDKETAAITSSHSAPKHLHTVPVVMKTTPSPKPEATAAVYFSQLQARFG